MRSSSFCVVKIIARFHEFPTYLSTHRQSEQVFRVRGECRWFVHAHTAKRSVLLVVHLKKKISINLAAAAQPTILRTNNFSCRPLRRHEPKMLHPSDGLAQRDPRLPFPRLPMSRVAGFYPLGRLIIPCSFRRVPPSDKYIHLGPHVCIILSLPL